jgi:hypothetical protein
MHTREATQEVIPSISPDLLLKITRLSVVLKLQLQFYQSLDNLEDAREDTRDDIGAWSRFDSNIRRLPRLKKLQIWFEHNDPCTWTVVNERVLLAPLIRLCEAKSLDITLSLPKLHPKFIQDSRHYTSEVTIPFRLYRRLRQRYHANTDPHSMSKTDYKPDFPYLLEVIDFSEMPMGELEELERGEWDAGTDMEREVDRMIGIHYCYNI